MDVDFTIPGALLLGLFGSVHCLAMCGGLAGALGQVGPRPGAFRILAQHLGYGLGRISSYGLAGGLAGFLGLAVAGAAGPAGVSLLRALCGVLLIAVGITLAGWWPVTARLEAFGARFWRRLAPWSQRLRPADRIWKHYLIGMIWGWLPCGLVYGALATAAATGNGLRGAAFMLAFGVGTLPALVATGISSRGLYHLTSRTGVRWMAGVLVIAFGLWTLLGTTRS